MAACGGLPRNLHSVLAASGFLAREASASKTHFLLINFDLTTWFDGFVNSERVKRYALPMLITAKVYSVWKDWRPSCMPLPVGCSKEVRTYPVQGGSER
eukprot:6181871-Pleurochrysis_carterae.AAC.1